jgi:hypothetical protein
LSGLTVKDLVDIAIGVVAAIAGGFLFFCASEVLR